MTGEVQCEVCLFFSSSEEREGRGDLILVPSEKAVSEM